MRVSSYSTVTWRPEAALRVAAKVRFFEPLLPSDTLGEEMESVGAGSSSVIVSVRSAGCFTPSLFDAAPDTVTLLSGSSRASSAAVIVTVPVLVVLPAAMVSVFAELRAKSPATAFVPVAAVTMIVVVAVEAASSVAVTVATPPFSEIDDGDSDSDTAGLSSSMTVTVTASWFVTSPPA